MPETFVSLGCGAAPRSMHSSPRAAALQGENLAWLESQIAMCRIISALHDSAVRRPLRIPSHPGAHQTTLRMARHARTVQEYVRTCVVCQQAKPDKARYPGLLQPLPLPNQPYGRWLPWTS